MAKFGRREPASRGAHAQGQTGGLRRYDPAVTVGSGGYRTVYVFGVVHMPVFLVAVFAKNEKDNLTKAEQAELIAMSKALLARYGG